MVQWESVSLMREVRLTEWINDTRELQLSPSKYFSGVIFNASRGVRRDETVWTTPFEA